MQSTTHHPPLNGVTHQSQKQVTGVVVIFKQGNRGPERSRILPRVTQLVGGRAELKQEASPHPPTLAHWLLWWHGKGPGAGGLTAWLSASPCRVSTPFTWSVLQHVGVRAAPAAAPPPQPLSGLSQDSPACPTAHPLDAGAGISLQGWAVATPPVLEGIPKGPSSQKSTPQPHPGFHPAQAHPQLPKTKFSCFVGPSVPEPGRVKRSEASWGAKGSGVNKVHRLQPSLCSISSAPRAPPPRPVSVPT